MRPFLIAAILIMVGAPAAADGIYNPNAPLLISSGGGGTPSGSIVPGAYAFNSIKITSDTIDAGSGPAGNQNAFGLLVSDTLGGSGATGNHIAITGYENVANAPSTAVNYVALWGFAKATVNVGGGLGTELGGLFGSNPQALLGGASATHWLTVVGEEIDNEIDVGSSSKTKIGLNITTVGADAVQGSSVDAALLIGSHSSGGWNNGILFSNFNGSFPVGSGGSLISATTGSITHGIDLSNLTCSSECLKLAGLTIHQASGASQIIQYLRTDATLASNAVLGENDYKGNDASGFSHVWAQIEGAVDLATHGSDRGRIDFIVDVGSDALATVASAYISGFKANSLQVLALNNPTNGFNLQAANTIGFFTSSTEQASLNTTTLALVGNMMIGSLTALTMSAGELGFAKIAASGSAPGAAGGKIELVCGTGAGTAKLIAYAGTSTTPVTILDNIGAGVTGC